MAPTILKERKTVDEDTLMKELIKLNGSLGEVKGELSGVKDQLSDVAKNQDEVSDRVGKLQGQMQVLLWAIGIGLPILVMVIGWIMINLNGLLGG